VLEFLRLVSRDNIEVADVQSQTTDIQGQLTGIQGQLTDVRSELSAHVMSGSERSQCSFAPKYRSYRTAQRAQQHNYIVKMRNHNDLMINLGHELLPLHSVLTGAKIPDCPSLLRALNRLELHVG
jgi:hypothetical protein